MKNELRSVPHRSGNAHRYPSRPQAGLPPYPLLVRQPARRELGFVQDWKHTELWVKIALLACLLAIPLQPVAAGLAFFSYYQIFERILPGVHLSGIELGGKTTAQAQAELQRAWHVERKLVVSDGVRAWEVSPTNLGLSLDASQVARAAFGMGHGPDIFKNIDQLIYSLRHGWEPLPIATLDVDLARTSLHELAPTVNIAAVNATLRLEGGQLLSTPPVNGYQLDLEATLAALSADPTGILAQGYLPLVLQPVAPRIRDVSAARSEVERLLNTPVEVIAFDPISGEELSWTASQEMVASWIEIHPGPDGLEVVIAEARLQGYLEALNESLAPDRWLETNAQAYTERILQGQPLTLIVKHAPTIYTVQQGETLIRIGWNVGMPYWKLLEANPGLNPDSLRAGQQIHIPSKDDLLPLPVVTNKRIVLSISQQRLWTFQDGGPLWEFVISTGIDRSPTQPGVFQVRSHTLNAYASVWDLYMPHFLGIYEAWPGFMNGIHGLPTLSSGVRLWANILGRPASYGCIILDLEAAERLYNWAEDGVVVEIKE